jgi:hypothetical protein
MTTKTLKVSNAEIEINVDDGAIRVSGVVSSITGALPAGTALIGKVGIDQATANANGVVVKSAIPTGTNTIGGTKDAGPSQTVTRTTFASADCSATPVDLTTAPTAKPVAMDIIISVATACTVHINTETTGLLFDVYMAANSTVQLTPRGYIKGATAAKKLQITTSVASAISGLCVWFEEA